MWQSDLTEGTESLDTAEVMDAGRWDVHNANDNGKFVAWWSNGQVGGLETESSRVRFPVVPLSGNKLQASCSHTCASVRQAV